MTNDTFLVVKRRRWDRYGVWQNNNYLYQARFLDLRADFQSSFILAGKAFSVVGVREKLYFDYEILYHFNI